MISRIFLQLPLNSGCFVFVNQIGLTPKQIHTGQNSGYNQIHEQSLWARRYQLHVNPTCSFLSVRMMWRPWKSRRKSYLLSIMYVLMLGLMYVSRLPFDRKQIGGLLCWESWNIHINIKWISPFSGKREFEHSQYLILLIPSIKVCIGFLDFTSQHCQIEFCV